MFRFGETKLTKETFFAAKKHIKIWDANVNNVVISKLVEIKTNSKYLVGYLDKVMRPSILIMPKMKGCVKKFKVNDKNNKLMSFQ